MNKEAYQTQKPQVIPLLVCGAPDLATTKELIVELSKNGAPRIELEIPFSDPIAENPITQTASVLALKAETTVDAIFEMMQQVREETNVPVFFTTYANVLFSYGTEPFAQKCAQVQADAVVLKDVPFEEKEEFESVFKKYGICFIRQLTPTSKSRIAMIAQGADGFLDCFSSLSAPKTIQAIAQEIQQVVQTAKQEQNTRPCLVETDLNAPDQIAQLAPLADGIILNTGIIEWIVKDPQNCVQNAIKYYQTILEKLA